MIAVGDRLPSAMLATMGPDGPETYETGALFAGKRAVLFGVPGAFTPTCSAQHLPGFRDRAADLAAAGVDLIACTSVNDVFVMDAWRKSQGVDGEVMMLADGNGDFATALGLGLDGSGFGMGLRSQRYAMLIEDGVVVRLFVEQGGAFDVSSADHMIDALRTSAVSQD
jgi:peroxiredoxin